MSEAASVPFAETKAPEAPDRPRRAIGVPVYYLVKPGQAAPYDWFPYAALGVIAVSAAYAAWLSRRDPGLGDRAGSVIADE